MEKSQKLVEETWSLYRTHFKKLVTTAAVVLLPVALLGFCLDLYFAFGMGGRAVTPAGALASLAGALAAASIEIFVLLPLTIVAGFLAQAAQTCQLEALARGEEPLSSKAAWKKLGPSLVPLAATSVLVSALAAVGMFALVIPGLWILYKGTLAAQVAVYEGKMGWGAFRRSGELVKKIDGSFWIAVTLFVVANYIGTSIVDAIFPSLVARLFSRLFQVVAMPLPLVLVWLTYRKVAVEASNEPAEELQAA